VSGIDFGFYPRRLELRAGDITISTLAEFDESVRLVTTSPCVDGSWFYAPPQQTYDPFRGTRTTKPYNARVFGLRKTHRLEHGNSQDPERLRFLMHCLGFFVGMRMDDTSAGFLDATPVKTETLTDFTLLGDSLEKALLLADRFWQDNEPNPKIAARVLGIFQSLSLASAPQALQFEEFIWAYTAIEGAFVVGRDACGVPDDRRHAQRISNLCATLGIPVPAWAGAMTVNVVGVRNEAIHEGVFLERPLGFETFFGAKVPEHEKVVTEAIPFAMRNFVCRVVLALLGIRPAWYLQSTTYENTVAGIRL
jgi:hypothetical protein